MQRHAPETMALHADRIFEVNHCIAPPLFQSVTHFADDEADFAKKASEPLDDHFYARHGNPNFSRIAAVIAALEGGESALMFASGMAAMSNAVLAFVSSGDHVIAQKSHYIGTTKLLQEVLPRFGVEVTQVDQTSASAFESAIRTNTQLIIVESPVNPTMQLTDLSAIAQIAKSADIYTICDNTFATPILQQPLSLGIDIVIHSVTKYIGGHHDLLAGCAISSRKLTEQIWSMNMVLGAIPAPFNAWLALRGIRTLEMRVRQHNANALAIAQFLQQHPAISAVHYPGLPDHPQYPLAQTQMGGNGGGVLTFEIEKGYEAGIKFIAALQLCQNAASLGGVDSLVIQPAVMWGGRLSDEIIAAQGISPGMIRMAVGIENQQDLLRDLEKGLAGI